MVSQPGQRPCRVPYRPRPETERAVVPAPAHLRHGRPCMRREPAPRWGAVAPAAAPTLIRLWPQSPTRSGVPAREQQDPRVRGRGPCFRRPQPSSGLRLIAISRTSTSVRSAAACSNLSPDLVQAIGDREADPHGTHQHETVQPLRVLHRHPDPRPPPSCCLPVRPARCPARRGTRQAGRPSAPWRLEMGHTRSVMQNRLASAGLWGLRERSVQVSGQQP